MKMWLFVKEIMIVLKFPRHIGLRKRVYFFFQFIGRSFNVDKACYELSVVRSEAYDVCGLSHISCGGMIH